MIGRTILIGFLLLSFLAFIGCAKQEHPAGAEEAAKKVQEHPADESAKKGITMEELAAAIEDYVNREAASSGGYFVVRDPEADTDLKLKLELVHKDRLSRISENVYFACADFKTPEGKIYDLDVFMEGTAKDNLKTTEVTVHKEEGEARYTWHEESGIWKKKYPKAKEEESEAPEHPTSEHPE